MHSNPRFLTSSLLLVYSFTCCRTLSYTASVSPSYTHADRVTHQISIPVCIMLYTPDLCSFLWQHSHRLFLMFFLCLLPVSVCLPAPCLNPVSRGPASVRVKDRPAVCLTEWSIYSSGCMCLHPCVAVAWCSDIVGTVLL